MKSRKPIQNEIQKEILQTRMASARIIAETLVVFTVFLYVFFMFYGLKSDRAYRVDDMIRSQVQTAAGRTEEFRSNYFGARKKGDVVHLYIGKHEKHFPETAALCFGTYNEQVRVFYNGEQIYARHFDEEERNTQVGHRYFRVQLPAHYNDGRLEIELTLTSDNTDTSLKNIYIYPAIDADRFVVVGHEFEFVVFSIILSVSVFLFLLLLFRSIRLRRIENGLYMSLFCFSITCWYMGFNGLFYYIIGNTDFCANIEYVVVYFVPIPLLLYLANSFQRRWYKKIAWISANAFVVFFATATICNYTTLPLVYSDLLPGLHVSLVVVFGLMVIFIYTDAGKNTLAGTILRTGLTIGIILGGAEILRIFLNQMIGQRYHFLSKTIAPFGILAFVVTLLLSFGAQFASDYAKEMETRELKRLAYIDTLTGIPNRASCYREIENMRTEKTTEYVMLFVDVNDLKKTNDQYGHEYGDQLIFTVATALGKAVEGYGFYGRWGGDEFIACVRGSMEDAKKVEARLYQYITESNGKHELPFEVSIAVGMAGSAEAHPLDYMEAINLADDRMYEEKKRMKKNR